MRDRLLALLHAEHPLAALAFAAVAREVAPGFPAFVGRGKAAALQAGRPASGADRLATP